VRAETALQQRALPGFSALALFSRGNLLPFAAALALFFSAGVASIAAEAVGSYQAGDFPAAEAAWRERISAVPSDWIAQHNLGLALAQQNRWGEASAHATAAFVQHPRDQVVHWNFALAVGRAGFSPGPITGFVNPSPVHSIALQFSPSEWQRVLVGAVGIAVLSGTLLLLRLYRVAGKWASIGSAILVTLAFVAALAGSVSLSLYQQAGDSRAVLVWKPSLLRSVPTEADTTQKTTPLAAGSMAVVEKTFLGWSQLSFSNGQTGWVRQEELVALWK
jgi:nitroreductase